MESMKNRSFVPATQLHMVPVPNKTQTAIDHLESLGYTVIAPSAKVKEELRAA